MTSADTDQKGRRRLDNNAPRKSERLAAARRYLVGLATGGEFVEWALLLDYAYRTLHPTRRADVPLSRYARALYRPLGDVLAELDLTASVHSTDRGWQLWDRHESLDAGIVRVHTSGQPLPPAGPVERWQWPAGGLRAFCGQWSSGEQPPPFLDHVRVGIDAEGEPLLLAEPYEHVLVDQVLEYVVAEDLPLTVTPFATLRERCIGLAFAPDPSAGPLPAIRTRHDDITGEWFAA